MTGPGNDILSRHPEAADSRVGDETVILHLGSGVYFGLDPVGTRIWEILAEPTRRGALMAQLLAEFDVSETALTADVGAFLGQMLDHDILRADPATE